MKKVFAILMAVMLLLCVTVTASAYDSKSGEKLRVITFYTGGLHGTTKNVTVGENIQVDVDPSQGTFNNWVIYTTDYKVAKKDVDYEIVSGDLKSATLVINPLTDLIICGNYNGKITDPKDGSQKKSPKTGDFAALPMALVMMSALACGFVAKKQLAK